MKHFRLLMQMSQKLEPCSLLQCCFRFLIVRRSWAHSGQANLSKEGAGSCEGTVRYEKVSRVPHGWQMGGSALAPFP